MSHASGRDSPGKKRKTRKGGRRGAAPEGLVRLEGYHVVLEALRARRRTLHRLLVTKGTGRELREVIAAAGDAAVPVLEVDAAEIRGPQRGANPQNVRLEAGPLPEIALEELCAAPGTARRVVVLDGVEDPQNLGAIARVAEAAGVTGLVLGRRRSSPLSVAATRASAGALEWLPVARVTNLGRALDALKREGFWVLAADPEAEKSLYELDPRLLQGDLVLVLGAEGMGIRAKIINKVDYLAHIPLAGQVSSLNVATAGAVVLFELARLSRSGGLRG